MSTVTFASGLGASATAKAQDEWGGTFMTTGQRTLIFKTCKMTLDPHAVAGGPYLAANQFVQLASTRIITWQSAKFTLEGDATNTALALLLISFLGTAATLTELGTSGAYEIGGADAAPIGLPDQNSTFFDFQVNVPLLPSGTNIPFSFHSCVVQKGTITFDRGAIVAWSFDCQAQYVENETAQLSTTEPTDQQVFSMATSNTTVGGAISEANASAIGYGTYGSEEITDGIKKATLSVERSFGRLDAPYLGLAYVSSPATDAYTKITWSLEADYTTDAQTLFTNMLGGGNTSLVVQSVGAVISGDYYDWLGFTTPAIFTDTGGEPSPDGPKIIGNTLSLTATMDPAGDSPMTATYITSDTEL